ncbi:MAG: hypothetical protein ACLR39_06500 [Oscillospiraceae bacterium]
MAAAPKKKKTSQPAKRIPARRPPAPTYGREIAGGVCLLLALCAVVSYFQEEALFITFFGGLLKGLLGYGYWLSAPALLLTGLLLLTHRDVPPPCAPYVRCWCRCSPAAACICCCAPAPMSRASPACGSCGSPAGPCKAAAPCPAVWPWAFPPYSARCCL